MFLNCIVFDNCNSFLQHQIFFHIKFRQRESLEHRVSCKLIEKTIFSNVVIYSKCYFRVFRFLNINNKYLFKNNNSFTNLNYDNNLFRYLFRRMMLKRSHQKTHLNCQCD